MEQSTDYNSGNDESRERLRALVSRLSDDDLARALGDGWTVAAMLAHLAFYDARAIALLKRYEASGEVAASPLDVDIINAAAKPLCLAAPARAAADLAVQLAEECDRVVAALAVETVAAIGRAGWPVILRRSVHRNEHLGQIEQALATDS